MLSNRWRIIVATPWAPHQHHINGPANSLLVGPLHNHPSCPIGRMDRVSHGAKSPHADQRAGAAEVPLQSEQDLQQRTLTAYSITSSARKSSDDGMLRPSVLAVFALMIKSNSLGCSTGRSDGFVPFRILST